MQLALAADETVEKGSMGAYADIPEIISDSYENFDSKKGEIEFSKLQIKFDKI